MTAPRGPRVVQHDLVELAKLTKLLDKAYGWAFFYGYDNGPSGARARGEDARIRTTKGTITNPTQAVAFSEGKDIARRKTREADKMISGMVSDARSTLQDLVGMFEHGPAGDDWDEARRMGDAGKFGRTASRADLEGAEAARRRREERGENYGQG